MVGVTVSLVCSGSLDRPLDSRSGSLDRPLGSRSGSLVRPLGSRPSSVVRPLGSRSGSLVRPLGSRSGSLVHPLVRSVVAAVGVIWPILISSPLRSEHLKQTNKILMYFASTIKHLSASLKKRSDERIEQNWESRREQRRKLSLIATNWQVYRCHHLLQEQSKQAPRA